MEACDPAPRRTLSTWAPKVAVVKISTEKLGLLIGPVSACKYSHSVADYQVRVWSVRTSGWHASCMFALIAVHDKATPS